MIYTFFFPACPAGWLLFNSSCYTSFKSDSVVAFARAEELCLEQEEGSHLPSIHSMAELSFLVEMGRRKGWFGKGRGVYLGGNLVEGEVVWTDGSKTDFTFWGKGNLPTFSNGCLAVFSSLVWKETSCYMDGEGKLQDLVICKLKESKSEDSGELQMREKKKKFHLDLENGIQLTMSQQMLRKLFIVVLIILSLIIIALLGIIFILLRYTCKISCNCSRKKLKDKSSHKKPHWKKEAPKEKIKNQSFVSVGKTADRKDFL